MDGLTPWEIASLKVVYHRIDAGHKGFLDRRDFTTMCEDCDLNLTASEESVLFRQIDRDKDGHITFVELLNYLTAVSFGHGGISKPKQEVEPAALAGRYTQKPLEVEEGAVATDDLARKSRWSSLSSIGKSMSESAKAVSQALRKGPGTTISGSSSGGGTSSSHDSHSSDVNADVADDDSPSDADIALFTRSAARIRQSYASDLSAIFAGGILGLLPLLKTKFFVVAGTLFYDPVRLFRDNIVDYTGSLDNNNKSTRRTRSAYSFMRDNRVPMLKRLAMSFVLMRGIIGVFGWIVFAATLDCLGGVVMFLSYSRARHKLATNESTASVLAGKRFLLEGCAGFLGGAAGGLVERPLRYVAHHRILNPKHFLKQPISDAFKGVTWAVYRQAVSHSVFFTAFSYSHDLQRWLWYRQLGRKRTSWNDACITAISGCTAGGSYRLVSLPMQNIYHATGGHERPWRQVMHPRALQFLHQHHGKAHLAVKSAYAGLGYSMLWIMPVTGAAFLVYERLLVNL